MGFFVMFLGFMRLKVRRKRVAAIDIMAAKEAGDVPDKSDGMLQSKLLFSWEDIQRFTMNFSSVIGHGGFSTVYLARFPDSSIAAVKIQYCTTERRNRAYKQELEIMRHLNHPNIVKLLGYCDDREEGILLLEYVPNGTLQERLHGSTNKGRLSWKKRMAIAFQVAQATEYLHNNYNTVHGDIKASNILLDDHLNCKLCDFGSAKMGFSSLVTAQPDRRVMQGSPGYTDPHYLRTGLATKKNDVFSFGVVLLELITGLEAFDPLTGERLTTRAEIVLRGAHDRVVEIVDSRLIKGDIGFDLQEGVAMATLCAMCFDDSPSRRPSMSHILTTMRDKISSISYLHA